jgi:hypothetical protein
LKLPNSSENKWNDLTNISKKYADIILNDKIIRYDENACKNIEKK